MRTLTILLFVAAGMTISVLWTPGHAEEPAKDASPTPASVATADIEHLIGEIYEMRQESNAMRREIIALRSGTAPPEQRPDVLVRLVAEIRTLRDYQAALRTEIGHLRDANVSDRKTAIGAGTTWKVQKRRGKHVCVSSDEISNPSTGDTAATVSLPILAIRAANAVRPPELKLNRGVGWSGGELRLTSPVAGSRLTSLGAANRIVRAELGEGWEMAACNEGDCNDFFWGIDRLPTDAGRFWIHVGGESGNCWSKLEGD